MARTGTPRDAVPAASRPVCRGTTAPCHLAAACRLSRGVLWRRNAGPPPRGAPAIAAAAAHTAQCGAASWATRGPGATIPRVTGYPSDGTGSGGPVMTAVTRVPGGSARRSAASYTHHSILATYRRSTAIPCRSSNPAAKASSPAGTRP